AAFGLRFICGSISLDFSSIHWSSRDFLKRQRLPSLNAGIFCSPTYLYKVSGLTPRYCDAWRIFITSRESAIVPLPVSVFPARSLGPAGLLRETASPCLSAQRALVSRAYISPEKPRLVANLRVLPGFSGVFWNAKSNAGGLIPIYCGFNDAERY